MRTKTKWYYYNQNNNDGEFEGPAVHTFIEAHNAEEANQRAVDYGLYFDGVEEGIDCECCGGDRWERATEATSSYIENEPEQFASALFSRRNITTPVSMLAAKLPLNSHKFITIKHVSDRLDRE